jgi:hypothetical protein
MKSRSILAVLAASVAFIVGVQAQPVQTWGRYLDITINTTATSGGANVTDTVSEFPLLVRLNTTNASAVLSEALSGGADVRFADAAGNQIPFEIEQWSSTSAAIWVRVPRIVGNSATNKVRLYWGKAGATSASRDSAVFNASNGYEAVFHLNENAGDTARDATNFRFKGIPTGSLLPTNVTSGVIGNGKNFNGNIVDNADSALKGGAYRVETSTGGNTFNSFNYTGLNAAFTVSTWVNLNALPASGAFSRRRGMVTKADHGLTTLDNNDPNTQWFLRPNTADRLIAFQRVATVGLGTLPYSVGSGTGNGGVAGVTSNWNYVTYVANGAGVDDNVIRIYNATARGTKTIADQDGQHLDVDVFIGGFASNSGVAGAKSAGTHFLAGMMDEVRISNVSRTIGWVDLEYETQKPAGTAVTLGAAQNNDTSRVMVYPIRTANYIVGQAIASVTPFVKAGNTVTAWAIAPALPATLAFSTSTGVISGTPNAASTSTQYIITATIGGNPVRDSLMISVTAGSPPGAPTGVSAVAASGQATVSWTAPASSGTTAISGYKAMVVGDTTAKTCTTASLSCTITGLTNGTSYTFIVRASNSIGASGLSGASPAVIPAGVPSKPLNVTVAQLGASTPSVTVAWAAPTDNGGSAVLEYYITGTPSGGCYAPAPQTTCVASGLTANTVYKFTVKAANNLGQGAASDTSANITATGIRPGSYVIRVSGSAKPFTFVLPEETVASAEKLTMSISDIYGRTVWSKTVNPKEQQVKELTWNGKSSNGRSVSAGMYVVKIATIVGGKATEFTQKAITIKPL